METKEVRVGDVVFGGAAVILCAGPCTVESADQLTATAQAVAAGGARVLRGGAYKIRTNPSTFQGLGGVGLALLAEAKSRFGLPLIVEITSPAHLDEYLAAGVDIFQVGARNMHNVELLTALGTAGVPVFIKRGYMATLEELVYAAEYVAQQGNENIILCERGIRTFETRTRFTLDVGAVAALKSMVPWPVAVDPSHAAGRAEFVLPLAQAAVAAGADALLVEVHPEPARALCDGRQSLPLTDFPAFVRGVAAVAAAIGRRIA